MFYNQKWEPSEEKHLRRFKRHLRTKQLELPEWWPDEESMRILHASNFDYPKTWTDINMMIEGRAKMLPIKLEDSVA